MLKARNLTKLEFGYQGDLIGLRSFCLFAYQPFNPLLDSAVVMEAPDKQNALHHLSQKVGFRVFG